MRGLLVKDFRLLTNQKQFFFTVVLIAAVFVAAGQDMSFVVTYCTLMGMFFTISSITYDEYDRGFTFLFTLPVTRKGYVLEKYLFMLLLGGGLWAVTTLLGIAVGSMRDPAFVAGDWVAMSFLSMIALACMMLVMLPINFKYGAEKSRNATLVFFAAFFAVFVVLAKFDSVKPALKNVLSWLEGVGQTGGLLLGVIVLAAAAGISISVSIRIMEKKEF